MLTFKAEVLKSKKRSDGTYNVKIRMTYNREVKRLSTNIFVKQEDLTKSFKLKNPKFIKEADTIVRYYQEVCARLQLDINHYTLDDIIAHLKGEQIKSQEIDFIQFSREWIMEKPCDFDPFGQTGLSPFGYNMIDPLKSWCWGSILFYPFKISRFS